MIVRIDPRSPLPTYEQLRHQIADRITSSELAPGDRLPPIRRLATDLAVAPGTVARAYRELEADGLVTAQGRRGTRVAAPSDWMRAREPDTEGRLWEAAQRYATLARQLGSSPADAIAHVQQALGSTAGGDGPGTSRQVGRQV